MEFIFALIAALSLSSIPLVVGWRRSVGEQQTARVLGIAARGKKFDPEKFALQTGTGLTFNQIALGFGAWVGGSFFAGIALGFFASCLLAIAGGLLYAGTLADRRQAFTLSQAKDILRGLQVVETLLTQGKTLFDSWTPTQPAPSFPSSPFAPQPPQPFPPIPPGAPGAPPPEQGGTPTNQPPQ